MSISTIIRLRPEDDVVIAAKAIPAGTVLPDLGIATLQDIPAGHKVAVRDLKAGSPVRKYNQIIGAASADIPAGAHIHVHNLVMTEVEHDFAIGSAAEPVEMAAEPATFMGIRRADGRVATRNYIGILTSVNCSARVARAIADHFRRDLRPEVLADFPNVDGVVALTHGIGCGVDTRSEGMAMVRRTLAGYAVHPNFGAVLMIGLGCEANQISDILAERGLAAGEGLRTFTIQEQGGTAKTIQHGIEQIKAMLPAINDVEREPLSASHIVVGLQCGGSDGYSGITANPALGAAVDLLVKNGGTAILSETPEVYGAEHLLTRRACSEEVGRKLIDRIEWWKEYCARNGAEMNNNPSAGNKAGGLTTILEKSLGAVAKGGTTPLNGVYQYAEPVTASGFVFMDSPGFDPISATGQVASGANLICFTTGRGSAFGCMPSPSLKLATNTATWNRQEEDMDINCGTIIDGTATIEGLGQEIFQMILDCASGKPSKSELFGYGQDEFVPWQVSVVT
ncbi:altronate dehydratase family protein [Shinella zoogloeoides]|uniref:UxaA family hydrolase n=1 Tax=Shinella zoogloeoides TaxID=352475 RepID=UPI00299D2F70|nr:altronate dehydratase family protein [Shinella zoogloeoides]WPE22671.1 Galactarate dehydratase (L-threo-forming) [Shinella zoogloeoides]